MKKYQTVETIEVRNNVEFRYLWDIEADTEEEAEKIAMNLPKKDWEDMSDERFIREYEVEEY